MELMRIMLGIGLAGLFVSLVGMLIFCMLIFVLRFIKGQRILREVGCKDQILKEYPFLDKILLVLVGIFTGSLILAVLMISSFIMID